MRRIAYFTTKNYRKIFITFIFLVIINAFFATKIKINYNLQDYLPSDQSSVVALDLMQEEYNQPLPNLRIALKDVSIVEAYNIKSKLSEDEEVKLIVWLDDFVNITTPINLIDKSLLNTYYKDNIAMIQLSIDTDNAAKSLNDIKKIVNSDKASYEGNLVSMASSQNATTNEIAKITAFMLPIGILILMLSVESIVEPFLLLLCIGVAIIINMGTNIFIGEISFLTQAVTAILQLAVSMDYALFMLHSWAKNKKEGYKDDEALENAIVESSGAVISSALTTVFGFIVLAFMKFKIGENLGVVLAKGVGFSLFSVIFFLPVLIKMFSKLIEKTSRKSLFIDFSFIGRSLLKFKGLILVVLVIIPIVFIAQNKNDFTYGMGSYQKDSVELNDLEFINSTFDRNTPFVILVPRNNLSKEILMIDEIKKLDLVTSIQSYSETVGQAIPYEIVPKSARSMLLSDNYSRIIVNTISESEGEIAFKLVEDIRNISYKYFKDEAKVAGESVTLYDMRNVVKMDNKIVNILAIVSVALVILFNFKSLTIPIILVLTIETSIWINLSIPYFTSTKLSYIGYLIISSIQLGATVDYGILFISHYMNQRQKFNKYNAIIESIKLTYFSILPPALILMFAGILLSIISSIAIVSELGTVLGRGAFLSLLLVAFVLPIFTYYTDGLISKTTKNTNFFKEVVK